MVLTILLHYNVRTIPYYKTDFFDPKSKSTKRDQRVKGHLVCYLKLSHNKEFCTKTVEKFQ